MRLGTETASITNHIYAVATRGQPEPVVGMGVTFLCWTDRRPGTIVNVNISDRYWDIVVQEDNARRIDKNGMSEDQEYEYTPNTGAALQHYRFDNEKPENGWRARFQNETGRWVFADGKICIGRREKYHDFSF
jgi:hypothetical protein